MLNHGKHCLACHSCQGGHVNMLSKLKALILLLKNSLTELLAWLQSFFGIVAYVIILTIDFVCLFISMSLQVPAVFTS